MIKRLFDIVFSFTGLIILSPVYIIIGIILKLDSKGPIFYRGVRVGLNRKHFKIFKFRTMVVNAEQIGGSSTADDDPRITKIGKFLRKYKLDELPQLINVLKGDMSFVGPRPEVPFYVNMFTEEEKAILTVKPGMTDYASIWDSDEGALLAGSPDPEKTYMEKIRPQKIKLQLEYVKKHSFWIDLKIIFKTLKIIALRQKT
jgi:lipopolysaccharide/colanic/teichoic acid biosynthesis glycosyltransferase